MAIKSALYYWITCDNCGRKSTDTSGYSAWADESLAIDDALDNDWIIMKLVNPMLADQHFCRECWDQGKQSRGRVD